MSNLTVFLGVFKTRFISNIAYRWMTFGKILAFLFQMLIVFYLWNSIFSWNNVDEINGFTFSELITYGIVALFISNICITWLDSEIDFLVNTGNVLMKLTNPIKLNVYLFYIFLSDFIFSILTVGLPGLLLSIFVLNVSIPELSIIFAFIISLILAALINFFIDIFSGGLAFWTKEDIYGFRMIKTFLFALFGGSFIPLLFFPQWFQTIAYLLPFQAAYNLPLLIYIGKIQGFEIIISILLQLFWVIVLYFTSSIYLEKSIKRFEAFGG
ncbi:MAG: ABC-2 family transporter protein [Candidatus Micrarchaeia archaeon]